MITRLNRFAAPLAARKTRWRGRWQRLPRLVRLALKVAAWAAGAYLGFALMALLIVASRPHP